MTIQNKKIVSTHNIAIEGNEVTAYRLENNVHGNPQYVVHFLDLGIKPADYGKIAGLTKYRAKWFGGGVRIVDCYNLQEDVKRALNIVKAHYASDTYSSDLHRNGELKKVANMERLARKMERESNGGLAGAYNTNGYKGADCIGMLAQSKDCQNKEGHIVFSEKQNKAIFIKDAE